MTDVAPLTTRSVAEAPRRLDRRRFRGLFVKELLQVVRDPSSILIAFVLPGILLFLFGYGLSLDADRLDIGLILEDTGPEVQSLVVAFTNSRYFDVRVARHRDALQEDLVAGRVRGLVVVPEDFSQRLSRPGDTAPLQVIADGSEPNTASFVQNYVQGVWTNWQRQQMLDRGEDVSQPIALQPRYWFNQELESRNFLVPGSIAIIMTVIGTLLTAMVVAREWERGTMEAIMATPASILEILVGKLAPYFLLGMGAMAVCVAVGVGLFGVPLRGSVGALVLISAAFLCPALGQGLLISTLARNQFVAAQVALISGFLPAVLLSGFIFEIGSMPAPIRAITYVVAARYLVSSLQTVFLTGDIWPLLLPNVMAMLAIGGVLFALTARKTKKRLD